MQEKDEQISQEDAECWRNDVSSPKETLKIADGETVRVVFISEGMKKSSVDFGNSVVFEVEQKEIAKNWYVSANNFNLLGQLKEIGKLIGQVVDISRTGKRRSDTRYTIKKIDM